MSLRFASFALALGLAACNDSSLSSPPAPTPTPTMTPIVTPLPTPTPTPSLGGDVVLYYGNGGPGPGVVGGGFETFQTVVDEYTAAGLTVSYTDAWPETMEGARLAFLVLPGYSPKNLYFDASQVADLEAVLAGGGLVTIVNDWGPSYSGTVVMNDLLQKLGSGLRTEDAMLGMGGATDLATLESSDPLVAGMTSLRFDDASRVLVSGSALCIGRLAGECVMGSEAIGGGVVVLLNDGQMLDDHAFATFGAESANNRLLARRLAQLP